MKLTFPILSCAISLCHALGVDLTTNGLLVTTQQGPVSGVLSTPTVRQFLGIPYATAQRWDAPVAPPKRQSTFQAISFGDTCPQNLSPANLEFLKLSGGQGIDIPESENCLSVNIWAPSTNRKQKTAVLLWVYGGAFQFGSSNLPIYGGQKFVRDNEDITVVTFNYRMNVFGQPNAPQLASTSSSQNFALLDLEASIQWVYENIAAFGGDPDRITLFGHSAGSTAIDAYTFSHPEDIIIKGVIQQSGNLGLVTNGLLANPTVDATTWNKLASEVGCGNTPTAAQLSCMKAVPFNTLEQTVIQTGAAFKLVTDNITIFSDISTRAAAGNFLKVPLLTGTTTNEGDIFAVASQLATSGVILPFSTEVLSDIQTETSFTCPASVTAQDRLDAKVSTWRYQYQAVFPNISPRPDLRAYHGCEIPLIFGSYNTTATAALPSTPTEIALSKYVQAAWVAFARDPSQGLNNFGWPQFSPTTNSLVQLGNADNSTGTVLTQGTLVDASCENVPQLLEFSAQLSANFAP